MSNEHRPGSNEVMVLTGPQISGGESGGSNLVWYEHDSGNLEERWHSMCSLAVWRYWPIHFTSTSLSSAH